MMIVGAPSPALIAPKVFNIARPEVIMGTASPTTFKSAIG